MNTGRQRRNSHLKKANQLLDSKGTIALTDSEILELEALLQEEMYINSEKRLFDFYKNFWNCHDPSQLHTSWVQECVAEHIEAALRRDIRRLTISIPPRQGKTKARDSLVLMADGRPRKIQDVRVGDEVLAFDVKAGIHATKRVINFWDEGDKEFHEVRLEDGQTVVCTLDHRLFTYSGYKTVEELRRGDRVSIGKNYLTSRVQLSGEEISNRLGGYPSEAVLTLLALWLVEDVKYKDVGRITVRTTETYTLLDDACSRLGFTLGHEGNRVFKIEGTTYEGMDFMTFIERIYQNDYYYKGYDFHEVPTYIPEICYQLPYELLRLFLSVIISQKSRIGKDSLNIRYRSEVFIDSLITLFNQLGFMCKKRHRIARYTIPDEWELYLIGKRNIVLLKDTFVGRVPGRDGAIEQLINRGRHDIEIEATSEEYWVRVANIRYVGTFPGYDIEVDSTNNFVLHNGIHSHNSTMSISAICHHWIKSPWEKFWLVSHSSKLFVQNIILTRRIMEHPLYRDRWMNPELQEHFSFILSKDVNTKTRVENDSGGYILGGSPSSGALGMGYTVAFLDDPLDSEEANSPDAVAKVNNWYTQTFLNRSNDVNTDVQIIVMQRLRSNDIIDYVNRTYGDQDWFNLVLPAKFDPNRVWFSPIGFNDPRKYKNELLDPVRLPDSFLAAQAKNQIIYNTRYQQDPESSGDGNMVQKEWIVQIDKLPPVFDQMITVWDLSFGDSPKSSFSVGVVLGIREGKFYCIDMIRDRMEVPEQVAAISELKKKYPKAQIGVEKRANGNAAISLLKREIQDIYPFQPRLFGGSKEQRLSSTLTYFRDRLVHVYSPFKVDTSRHITYNADVIIKELVAFPLGEEDDIVDCFGYGLQWLAEFGKENMAIITGGQDLILPSHMGGTEVTLRGNEYRGDEFVREFEYDMFGGNTSRSSVMDLTF
jgi:phage terminase large subunit-like protein